MAASSLGGTCRGPAHLEQKLSPVTHCPVAQHNWRCRGQQARVLGSPSWPGCRAHRVATRKGRPPEARDRPTAAAHQRGGSGGHPNFLLAGPEAQVPQPCGHHSLPKAAVSGSWDGIYSPAYPQGQEKGLSRELCGRGGAGAGLDPD